MLATLMSLVKGNFLAGKKSYALLWGFIAINWVGFAFGVDFVCVWGGGAEDACAAPTLNEAIDATWQGLLGVTIRKGIGNA